MTIKFAHYPEAQIPHTVGYQINENMTVTASFAQLSEGDKYNHKIARALIRGRIEKGGVAPNGIERTVTYLFEEIGEINHRSIASFLSENHFPVLKGKTRREAYAILRGIGQEAKVKVEKVW